VALKLFLVVLLIAANGFSWPRNSRWSASAIRGFNKLIEAPRWALRLVHAPAPQLDQVLLGVQFGVTLASLAWAGWRARIEQLIEPFFRKVPHAAFYAHGIAATLAFALITYMQRHPG